MGAVEGFQRSELGLLDRKRRQRSSEENISCHCVTELRGLLATQKSQEAEVDKNIESNRVSAVGATYAALYEVQEDLEKWHGMFH